MFDQQLIALDTLTLGAYRTKEFVRVLENLHITDGVLLKEKNSQQMLGTRRVTRVATHKALVVIADRDDMVQISAANVPNVKVVTSSEVNVYDLLKYRRVVMTQDAIKTLEDRLA